MFCPNPYYRTSAAGEREKEFFPGYRAYYWLSFLPFALFILFVQGILYILLEGILMGIANFVLFKANKACQSWDRLNLLKWKNVGAVLVALEYGLLILCIILKKTIFGT